MKKTAFLLIPILLLILVCSCELAYDAPKVGKMHILVYGNDYAGTSNKLTKTINDAVQVGNALVKLSEKADISYDITYLIGPTTTYNSSALEEDQVINDVSKERLLDTLTSVTASETDITIVYLSGHGFSDVGLNKKVLYGTDTSALTYFAANETSSYGSAYTLVSISDLKAKICAISGTKILISDFCYSGGFVQSDYVSVTQGDYTYLSLNDLYVDSDKIDDAAASLDLDSVFYLTAARYNQKSYEKLPLHGNFTAALLEALGWDEDSQSLTTAMAQKNNMITLFNVARYCSKNDRESMQTPMLSGGSNDVILFSF